MQGSDPEVIRQVERQGNGPATWIHSSVPGTSHNSVKYQKYRFDDDDGTMDGNYNHGTSLETVWSMRCSTCFNGGFTCTIYFTESR